MKESWVLTTYDLKNQSIDLKGKIVKGLNIIKGKEDKATIEAERRMKLFNENGNKALRGRFYLNRLDGTYTVCLH